jgi:hypothetical protein
MALLLVILIPLAALATYAVVFDLRHRRRGAPRSHDISSATRTARADADADGASGLSAPPRHSRRGWRRAWRRGRPLTILMFHGQGRGWRLARSGKSCHTLPL